MPEMRILDLSSAEENLKKRRERKRRERIATAVLAGIAGMRPFPNEAAKDAVTWADALIAELDKK